MVGGNRFQPIYASCREVPGDFAARSSGGDGLEETAGTGGGEEGFGEREMPVEFLGDGDQILGWVQAALMTGDPTEEVAEEGIEGRGDVWGRRSAGPARTRSAHEREW